MKDSVKRIYILIAAMLIVFPVLLMPFFVKKNTEDIQEMDYRRAVTFDDVLAAEFKKITFEDWFNDHLAFRKSIISSHAALNLALNVSTNSQKIVIGKDRWLFLGDDANQKINKYRRAYMYDVASVARGVENIRLLDEKLSEQNIDFICVMAPDKSSVYPEYMPDWATKASKPTLFEVVNRLGDNDVMLDLTPVIVVEKEKYQDDLYSKTNSHWNSLGAYFGYLKLMNTLNKDKERPLKTLQQMGYEMVAKEKTDELEKMLGFTGINLDCKTRVNVVPKERVEPVYLTEDTSWKGFRIYENDKALNPETILVIGDSFSEDLLPYYYNTYSKVHYLHYEYVLYDYIYDTQSANEAIERIIADSDPDTVVWETVERDFYEVIQGLPEAY